MRRFVKAALVAAWTVILVPAAAYGQASITGVVTDSSGAVLPGVTVEASSPVLIEKVRSATTDTTGQYRIVDLRPGPYTVTFTLLGFSTVKREGLELTGSFTATVSVEMRVGAIEETITVAGETPIVDVHSVQRQQVLDDEVIASIPTVRNYNALLGLVPGITTGTNDVSVGPLIVLFAYHGGPTNEGRFVLDGITVGNAHGGNSVSNYTVDIGNSEEVTFTTSGGLGEAETAGVLMNVVPRTGGNTRSGSFFASGANSSMHGSNFTQALKDAGVRAPNPVTRVWDVNGASGGPIWRDRLWYFGNVRTQGTTRFITNLYYNLNANDATKWTYAPDLSRQAFSDRTWNNAGVRLTWQVTPRNKINVYWDEQSICGSCTGATSVNQSPDPLTSPEAQGIGQISPQRVQQVSWSSPATSRILLEGGLGTLFGRWGNGAKERQERTRDLVRVTEQCIAGCPDNGGIAGLTYRSVHWGSHWLGAYNWRAAMSYVTGAHAMKVGYQGYFGEADQTDFTNNHALAYRVNNGVPDLLTMYGDPFTRRPRTATTALYAQEQWTRGRLTLQGAVRFDHAWSYFLDQRVGPTRFISTALVFPKQDGVTGYQDVTTRMNAAYDLRGNGKTAIKVNVGKYLAPASVGGIYSDTNPVLRLSTNVTRSWIDGNRNWTPDCDLWNRAAQDLRTAGGDLCGAVSNQNFGQLVFSNTYDPALLGGWGVRPSNWSFGLSVQQEVLPRTSVEVGYFRRSDHNFTVTDNRAVASSDFNTFCVTAPSDARLPDGGGHGICELFDVSPAKFGQVDNFITAASNYGNQTQRWQGVDVNVNARLSQGLTVQGGTSTGQTVTDNCEIRAALPEIAPLNPYCHVATGFLTQVRGLATYTVPRADIQLGAAFQSKLVVANGLAANYSVTNAAVAPSLGRSLAGNRPSVTVNVVAPGSLYGDRVNQLDVRAAKILRFGRMRTTVGVDVYNVLNSAAILTYNQTFIPGGAWLTPTSVLTARLARVNVDVRF